MRVAMALDNTGSMAEDGRMPAMQKAAKDLVDQLSKLAKHDGDSYISIVPFAKDVNFGVDAAGNSNANKRWIDWSLWDTAHGSWGKLRQSNAAQIDARQKILCDNAKAPNHITIYTVQVNTGGDPTSAVLQYCASSSDKIFLVTSASQTVAAFSSIGTSLSKLCVAK